MTQSELETHGEIDSVRILVGTPRTFSGVPRATHALDVDGLPSCKASIIPARFRRWQDTLDAVTCSHCRRRFEPAS